MLGTHFMRVHTQPVTAAVGQAEYTTAGTFSWTVPDGVSSVSVVCVGGGGNGDSGRSSAGGGGGLGWKNNIAVTPGDSITVEVGSQRNDSYFDTALVVAGLGGTGGASAEGSPTPGGSFVGDGGGNGGLGGDGLATTGGGGAGGYSGNGGNGVGSGQAATNGSGGGGAGGNSTIRGGGGVGLQGEGANGVAPGGGGSGGADGGSVDGGAPGGGGGATGSTSGAGTSGAVRIIWPGSVRRFPSTRTADE